MKKFFIILLLVSGCSWETTYKRSVVLKTIDYACKQFKHNGLTNGIEQANCRLQSQIQLLQLNNPDLWGDPE